MKMLFGTLYCDEAGFVVSAELILVTTIAVLSLVVGLSGVASSVNHELGDVASAFGAVNQSYRFAGVDGHHGRSDGGRFRDRVDFCDDCDIESTRPHPEHDY